MLNRRPIRYAVFLVMLALLFVLTYVVDRHETFYLFTAYSIAFALYIWIIKKSTYEQLWFWIYAAIGFRLVVLFSVPNLSDDFYRFIWDGKLLVAGYHPFANIPSFYAGQQIDIPGAGENLYLKLNSKDYFTIYPPMAQLLFWISAKLSSGIYGSLITLKVFIFMAEIGNILLLRKLSNHFNIPSQHILMYALNPLVIVELTGNAHFEAVLILFILLSSYFLSQRRLTIAAFFFAMAVSVKLIPLIFLPAILSLLGRKKALQFFSITAVGCILLFLPLLDIHMFEGFKNSIGYYFTKFEFNASVYYIVRSIGYFFFGYNIIQIAGTVLGIIAFILIVKISLQRRAITGQVNAADTKWPAADSRMEIFLSTAMWSLVVYLLFTTTIHPWYITSLLALCIFTPYRFPVLWTFAIFFTYAGYTLAGFEENLWIVAFEYIIVLGYLAYELLCQKLKMENC